MRKILFATDGSEQSKKAAEAAKQLLQVFPTTELVVLNVTAPMVYPMEGFIPQYAIEAQQEHDDTVRREMLQAFESFQGRVTYLHEDGSPATWICDTARQKDIDLIIVGSHGKTALDRVLLGSVSNAVVHHSNVSVLVVK